MATAIDLNNFRVIKTGNIDVERDYINAILHAIVDYANDLQSQINASGGSGSSDASYITVIPEASLPGSRVLVPETGVISLGDSGNQIVVGIVAGGISAAKLNVVGTPSPTTVIQDDGTTLTYVERVDEVPDQTILGNNTGSTAVPIPLTGTEVTAMLDLFTATDQGLVPPPGISPTPGWYLDYTGNWSVPGGGPSPGTVTSVALSAPVQFTVTGSPVTTSGTLTLSWTNELQNLFLASPDGSTGVPSFRAIVAADLPNSGVSAGSYGDSTHIPTVTVDVKGRVTSASQSAITVPTGANPTAQVGLSAVNGSAGTFMRSDGAPALNQGISPTWIGTHTFSLSATFSAGLTSVGPVICTSDHFYGGSFYAAGGRGFLFDSTSGGPSGTPIARLFPDGAPATEIRLQYDPGGGFQTALAMSMSDGAITIPTNFSANQDLHLGGVISPTALSSGNNNDWNPTGLSTASIIRVSTNASGSTITGITAPSVAGKVLYLVNISAGALTISDNNIASSASNRIRTNASSSIVLAQNQGCMLWYDGTSSRWRVMDTIPNTSSFITAATQVDVFTSSGTWTKLAGAKFVYVYLLGAGGGGAGGSVAVANTFPTPGGGGGARRIEMFNASTLGSSETVTIGTGGAGGAASTSATRNAGGVGGNTSFGSWVTAFGGGAPPSGVNGSGNAPGAGAGSLQAGGVPANVSATAVAGRIGGTTASSGGAAVGSYDAVSEWGGAAGGSGASAGAGNRGGDAAGGGPGGGAGGGQTTTTGTAGGDGGWSAGVQGGTGGTSGGAAGNGGNGNNGSDPTSLFGAGSGGGGGGSAKAGTGANTGGTGGNGGRGAGGGGGGNANNTAAAGAGGNGGNGYAVIITYF